MEWKLEVVPVPVTDVDKAKAFYAERCGFVVDHDTRVNDEVRFVQLTPPGSACSVVIQTGHASPPGSVQGLQLVVPDIDAARAELAGRGVDVSTVQHFDREGGRAEGRGGPWNAFVFFGDPDGNGWVVQERPA
ncbi:VOC family protein [Nonomuraea rhizosphaerae]|uniref:VOC family protein n=1 Tax=Nonomuraea rhizosphaerae TaxID=2665663 RepID=UPI001C603267|nr:VOC family protein [Nonomuraea rhizosphaerae]